MTMIYRIVFLTSLTFFLLLTTNPVFAFSTHDTTISRTFIPYPNTPNSIKVTITFTNKEAHALHGFYYTENIPAGVTVNTLFVKLNGDTIDNTHYTFETGALNDIYPNYIPYRWILELPPAFEEGNPLSQNGRLEISYIIQSQAKKSFHLDEFSWVGYYPDNITSRRAAFGYNDSPNADAIVIADVAQDSTNSADTSHSSQAVQPPSESDQTDNTTTIPPEITPPSPSESVVTEDTVTEDTNTPPVADAGPNQTVPDMQEVILLNGSNSFDTDDEIVEYSWKQIEGIPVSLSSRTAKEPYFEVPLIGPEGETVVFELTVFDESGASAVDECIVNIVGDNAPPIAEAGEDQEVYEDTTVILDASNSVDTDGDIVHFEWIQIYGPDVTIYNSDEVKARFVSPKTGIDGETLLFKLITTDDKGLKTTDVCIVNVLWENEPPIADAGKDMETMPHTSVYLDGRNSSDIDDNDITFRWKQISGIPVTLSDPASPTSTFTAPEITVPLKTLSFSLTVTDAHGLKSMDHCNVTIIASERIDTTPPEINLETEVKRYIHSKTLTLCGTAFDANGLSEITWVSSSGNSGRASGLTNWTITDIPLQRWYNVIRITAKDTSGNKKEIWVKLFAFYYSHF